MNNKIALVLGIRPDVIRAAEIIKKLRKNSEVDFTFIWSGQHYSQNLKDVFFQDLNLEFPDLELNCTGETDAEISSSVIKNLYQALSTLNPAAVMFLGDTNTVLGSISAAQLNIPIIHIEGCMRSYDWRMPEEKCRTVIDHLSDVIYTYYDEYKLQGIREGLRPDSIIVIQNLIVDILNEYFFKRLDEYRENFQNILSKRYAVHNNEYYLATIHRRENVESHTSLDTIFKLFKRAEKPIIFPASYRTQRQIKLFNLSVPKNVQLIDPIGYNEILSLMDGSYAVMTDSGTIVEETAVIGIPSLQIRKSTERPQVYDFKSSVKFDPLAAVSEDRFSLTFEKLEHLKANKWKHELGDGKSSERILQDIVNRINTVDGFKNHLPQKYHIDTSRSFIDDGIVIDGKH